MLIYSPPALILAEKRARLRMCVYTCAEMKAKLEYLRKYKIQITHISPPRVQRIIRVELPRSGLPLCTFEYFYCPKILHIQHELIRTLLNLICFFGTYELDHCFGDVCGPVGIRAHKSAARKLDTWPALVRHLIMANGTKSPTALTSLQGGGWVAGWFGGFSARRVEGKWMAIK